jgi:putative nucleotidyltransferase with HDIG domain
MNQAGSSFKDIGDVLESDPAIAGRVLRLANSAYYGLSGKVSSIQHASVVLGVETLAEVIAMAGTSSFLGKSLKGYNLSSGDLWRHSLAVAIGAKMIAHHKNPTLENDAFTAGLFHDAGKIILDPYVHKYKDQFQGDTDNGDGASSSSEIKILGFDHAEIAAEMCAKWKIPEAQAFAIRFHHAPNEGDNDELASLIYVANTLNHGDGDSDISKLDENVINTLNLTEEELQETYADVKNAVEMIVSEMNV